MEFTNKSQLVTQNRLVNFLEEEQVDYKRHKSYKEIPKFNNE
jgi:phage antirepressor YoqD-like protein